jgi:site-specific recombinase XerD
MSVSMLLTRLAELRRLRQGPLEPHLDTYVAHVIGRGFNREIARRHLWAVSHLSTFMAEQGLPAHGLDEKVLKLFLRVRVRYGRFYRTDPAAAWRMLHLLRELGVCPEAQAVVLPATAKIVADYHTYLLQERGLARTTITGHLSVARLFLTDYPIADAEADSRLCADNVITFIQKHTRRRNRGTAKNVCLGLRAFLRYLLYSGRVSCDLASAVPRVADYALSTLPRCLRPREVEQVLRHCDRHTPIGRRDYAILVMLARLGLRASEVVALSLGDIDWHSGQFCLRHTKSRADATMPLPSEVGRAIADYLRHGRPRSASRRVFLRHTAPVSGLAGASNIGFIVRAAFHRAGVLRPNGGAAHLFRHGLATRMLGNGASLRLIGELLRHQDPDTTRIYAKVDVKALRTLAQPWPGGAA